VPPNPNDTPVPAAGGGGGFGGARSLATNQVVFIYLKFFDGVWTTHQSAAATPVLQNGVNHLMAGIDEVAEQDGGK
jgi:hypothetical protein